MFPKHKLFIKGFTLIELLTVIAIIGIMSSIIVANLNNARSKGRDAKRIADVKQLQLLLELYFDNNAEFPNTLSNLVTSGYISVLPIDPFGGNYPYDNYSGSNRGVCYTESGNCVYYHIGALLELSNSVLLEDVDLDGKGPGSGADADNGPDGLSTLTTCGLEGAITATTDRCYDLVPQ